MATPPMLDQRPGARLPARPDPVAALSVALLALLALALCIGLVLAVYDWRTPGALAPLAVWGSAVFGAAILVLVLGAAVRWARSAPR